MGDHSSFHLNFRSLESLVGGHCSLNPPVNIISFGKNTCTL